MLDKFLFFLGTCVIGGITMYLKYLSDIILNSDIPQKKEIEVTLAILILIVMFGGVGILYKYCPPF